MIGSLLIANRGEIACRVIRTAQRLGIRTVAVYSDADADALHVRMADEAVHIGPSPVRESYLVGEAIIAAAKDAGAEAIHPGYGFLSENADFAQAVLDAGLVWVGPKPASIRAMGLKDAAKKLMADAGVPVTPGYLGDDQRPERLKAEADAIGYPVLIKAVAGGGGKGMRKVDRADDFADALASCQREAASSFGNDVVLIEKYILSPRHIEVQVFGDGQGNVVHLFERDCSLQRRHQKVIEEAPAPGMDEATRAAVCGAAVRAAQAVDYEGAGTIEFIADASEGLRADRVWFMEMNTRLQVEHPVTEEITGQDLVEWQLRVASGEPLPRRQEELSIHGHAIEARLYAEDPATGFLPSTGVLEHFDLGEEGRIETGVEEGDEISPFYDPMIAKLVVLGDDREEAIGALAGVIDEVEVWPVRTNAGFLFNCLLDDDFGTGEIDTGFIARKLDELVPAPVADEGVWRAAAVIALARDEEDPLAGFRLNAPSQPAVTLSHGSERRRIILADDEDFAPASGFRDEERVVVFYEGQAHEFSLGVRGKVGAAGGDGSIIAPMPGKVTSVDVTAGASVTKGQRLLTLEAMKMEHAMFAPFDGTVTEINVEAGQQVAVEAVLATVELVAV
ncbi:acetyl/propionyl/methylcrotonyl-CoA carboxylase subunit alpha [Sphingomonas astaxanthinifaciens]|uniref:3-methylcrotonyl-CoA carboxylase subunit alpha n=1 Tax=Sphingomonas astaxanthinifaciens DSM 22298 TaxID=1123267 RepID=A0ABQ5Z3R1_9SPHN|nr:acetyl/propionyl/methylcrotonyl-CoA carboxylase subunit alpha [Sphingomonas astaxanthinifaciens]GLR47429.1 3-methylcrotonyl-CoA carboxylase subunit alpha [Sphingomonas astaxanthinifaciens DSM 22298]